MTSSPPTRPVMITTTGAITGRVYVARHARRHLRDHGRPPARRGSVQRLPCRSGRGRARHGPRRGARTHRGDDRTARAGTGRRRRHHGLRPAMRGSIAIVGLAEYGLGVAPEGSTPVDVMGHAALGALADAGLKPDDVDGLLAASTQLPWASVNLGEWLDVNPSYSDSTQLGGSSFMAHLHHAALAIHGGACEVALVAYGSTQRSVGRARASVQELDPGEAPYRPMNPVTAYALAASRHMHEFGTTREQLAEVAVAARTWAQRNPNAWSTKDLTISDV